MEWPNIAVRQKESRNMNVKLNPGGWLWVFYPVIVVVFMVLGMNFLVTSGQASLAKLTVKQSEIEAEKLRAENLKTKLEGLKLVDREKSLSQLGTMLAAVPPARSVWLLINELNQTEARSGMQLVGYKGTVGDVREATQSAGPASGSADLAQSAGMLLDVEFDTPSMTELATGLAIMERWLPLVKIVKIDFEGNAVKMIVEGAWSAWPAANTDLELALPRNQELVEKELSQLVNYENVAASPGATF
jgi:hypothetical protein